MNIEISKIDWGYACKDTWTIVEGTQQECRGMLAKDLMESIRLCHDMQDNEFLCYNIYVDGVYVGNVREYFDDVYEQCADAALRPYFCYAIADSIIMKGELEKEELAYSEFLDLANRVHASNIGQSEAGVVVKIPQLWRIEMEDKGWLQHIHKGHGGQPLDKRH